MPKHQYTLSNRLVRSYSLVFALIMLVTGLFFFYYIIRTGEQISILNQKELTNQTMIKVETYLDEIDSKSSLAMNDSRIISIFGRLQTDTSPENYFDYNVLSSIDAGSILASINGPSSPIWRISVYNQYGDFVSAGAIVDKKNVTENLISKNVGEDMVGLLYLPDRLQLINPQNDKWSSIYSSQYVTIKRPLMNIYSKEVLGIVEVQQDISKLYEKLGFETLKELQINIYDSNNNLLLSKNKTNSKNLFSSVSISDRYKWRVELVQSRKALLSPYFPIIIMLGVGILVLLAIVILTIFLIARRLSKPLVLLAHTMGEINIDTIPNNLLVNESTEEVKALKNAFASMITRINNSISHERRAWLLALQSQMNPHFLYNMLSVISAAAMEGGNNKVVDMCSRMSKMFRYVASYSETSVTVNDELVHVRNYLELMKERYEDYFNFEIDADDEILKMPIPKLVMQPLAENCFLHGFKNIEPPYFIKIEAKTAYGAWFIKVIDNGCGMTEEEKNFVIKKASQYEKSLPENYANMKIGGMGLISSILRFKLQASKNVDYSIEDNKPQGTIITIRGEM